MGRIPKTVKEGKDRVRRTKMDTKKSHHYKTGYIILLLNMIFIGCNSIFPTPINKILENPRDYGGKSVVVSGEVTEIFGFFGFKNFVVKDKTGERAVVTTRPLPKKGTTIRVKGTVEEAFSIGDRHLIVIVEKG